MGYYRYYKLQKYIDGVAQDEYKQGARVNTLEYDTYNECMNSPLTVTRWSIFNSTICDGTTLYYMEKEQVSYDDGETWTDTGNTRKSSSVAQYNSSTCGYKNQWVVVYDDTQFMCDEATKNKYRIEKEQTSTDGGQTWTDTGNTRMSSSLIEAKSVDCGALYDWETGTSLNDYYCGDNYTKYTKEYEIVSIDDGATWTRTGNARQGNTVLETESADCGYRIEMKLDDYNNLTNFTVSGSPMDFSVWKDNSNELEDGQVIIYDDGNKIKKFDICSGDIANTEDTMSNVNGYTNPYYDGDEYYYTDTKWDIVSGTGYIRVIRYSDGKSLIYPTRRTDHPNTGYIISPTSFFGWGSDYIKFFKLNWDNGTIMEDETVSIPFDYSDVANMFYQPELKRIVIWTRDSDYMNTSEYFIGKVDAVNHTVISVKKYKSNSAIADFGNITYIIHTGWDFEPHYAYGKRVFANVDLKSYIFPTDMRAWYQYNLLDYYNGQSVSLVNNRYYSLLPCTQVEVRWVDSGETICNGDDLYKVEKEQSSTNGGVWVDTGVTRTGDLIESGSTDCVNANRWISNNISSALNPTSNTGFTIEDYGSVDGSNSVHYFKVKDAGTRLSFEKSSSSSGLTSAVKHADYLDLSNVTILSYMFRYNTSMESGDFSKWNTHNVTHFNGLFTDTPKLTSVDISMWDMSKAYGISNWLGEYNNEKIIVSLPLICTSSNLTEISGAFNGSWMNNTELNKLVNWNFANVTKAYDLFYYAGLSGDISDITNKLNFKSLDYASQMFRFCTDVTKIDISNWGFVPTTNETIEYFFANCTSLTEIVMQNVDWTGFKTTGLFTGCSNLQTINAVGCNSETISIIQSRLKDAGLTSKVTIIS